jgi:CubicO group peptidase (beta-lactamase class C family)
MLYTQGKTDCKPAEIGYNADRLNVRNKHFQIGIDTGEIQCATYCISRKEKVFAHAGIGKKSFRTDDDTLVLPDSPQWIASITKTFVAVAIMKLVEDGLTRLDVPVGQILPQFDTPPFNQINLFHLLTHTSGLHADGGCFENKYQTNYWKTMHDAYKLHDFEKNSEFDWIAAALGTIGSGMRTPPEKEWAYCNFGFTILGAVIEKLTGIHAHKYIEDEICKPLGLHDTMFEGSITAEIAKRSIIHDEEGEKYFDNIINGSVEKNAEDSPWEKYNIPSTGGGMLSTVGDLVRYGNMVLNNGQLGETRILGRKAVEKMTALAADLPDYCWFNGGGARGYAVGFDRRNGIAFTMSENTIMHEGSGSCAMYIDPTEELVAAWIIPMVDQSQWYPRLQFSTVNVIWSGLL